MLLAHFSATLRVPTTAESAALTEPPPVALYENDVRVADAGRSICLPALPSVTGIVCVPTAWRTAKWRALDEQWLECIRNTLIEQLCAQLEELDDAENTAIMSIFKPQFNASSIFVDYLQAYNNCRRRSASSRSRACGRCSARCAFPRRRQATHSCRSARTFRALQSERRRVTPSARFTHNTILFVCAASFDAAAADPLVTRAMSLAVETLIP